MNKTSPASDPLNFSLVLGGPLFQLFRRAHLSGDDLELLTRRVIFVSIPLLHFLLLRWYMRLGLWFWLLWRTSKLNLRLTAAHPDRAGGIGFLGKSSYAFGPVLFARGTLLSGLIASRVLYDGQSSRSRS